MRHMSLGIVSGNGSLRLNAARRDEVFEWYILYLLKKKPCFIW